MRASVLNREPTEGTLIFSHVGRSGTVALFDQEGDIRFLTNGLPESIVAQYGTRLSPFAASGAWVGVRKHMDLFGVLVLGVVTAVGGGTLRDLLLGQEWLWANGMTPEPQLAYFTDSFGSSPALPSLLRAAGFEPAEWRSGHARLRP